MIWAEIDMELLQVHQWRIKWLMKLKRLEDKLLPIMVNLLILSLIFLDSVENGDKLIKTAIENFGRIGFYQKLF